MEDLKMNYKAFLNYMLMIENAIDSQYNHHDQKAATTFEQSGRWALRSLEEIFLDEDENIRRWLNAKPCIFTSDKTGKRIQIRLGRDRDALYYFLIFCKKLHDKEEIDQTFRDCLALIISRSCFGDDDAEL